MQRELALAGVAGLVLLGTVLAAVSVPGIVAEPVEEDLRPSRLAIAETTLAAGEVSGSTATIVVDTYLGHRGGPAENVTVRYRATDLETGLVATTVTREVGTVETEGETLVTANLSVPREGGYRVETIVYEDGERVRSTSTDVRGVGTLTPAYARTDVAFHEFDAADIPSVQYSIAEVSGNRTTIEVSTYLTNSGDEPAEDLQVVLVARQADSNIVADRAEMDVSGIRPGRTASPSTELTVPSEYNYYLDAVLYKDGVVVGTASSAANLDPTETISRNETRRDVGLEVGDFEQDGDGADGRPTGEPTQTASAGPGFGVLAALAALGGSALLARRWSA